VKAVVPIRRGREEAAIKWLKQGVVGSEGLTQKLPSGKSVEESLLRLAKELNEDQDEAERLRAADRVFEHGFNPLEGGTAVPEPFPVFAQWVEVLPTDQIIAEEFRPET